MKPGYRDVVTMFAAAGLAIGLAACGGSSSKRASPETPPALACPEGREPDAAGDACADTPETAAARVSRTLLMAHQEAAGATLDAGAAGRAAAQALEDALEYAGMLDADDVKGDSATARMNAEMVLAARDAVDRAVMDAEAAKRRAMDAETEVMALPEGTGGRMLALEVLGAAIDEVDDEIAAATAIQTGLNADGTDNAGGQRLQAAVQSVTGTNQEEPGTPGDVAERVAMAVAEALGPTVVEGPGVTNADGAALRVTHYDGITNGRLPADAPAVMDRTFHATTSPGMTWAMIVGEDNIVMERIGAGNTAVPVASIAGMDASTVDKSANPRVAPDGGNAGDGQYSDGASPGSPSTTDTPGTEYMGIPGEVWCLGGSAGCSVAAGGTLGDGWYFTPSDGDAPYIENPTVAERAETPYVPDIDYVLFGHWLTVDNGGGATDGQVTVHTYAILAPGGNSTGLRLTEETGEGAVNTATYTGSAAGMSVHRTFDGNGVQTGIDSGAFTADVSLTATFGAAPMLGGTVDNFRGGAHIDSGWSVELEETSVNSTTGNFGTDPGVAQGSGQGDDFDGQAGVWWTQGHGVSGERPTGFFGNFAAHFTDGHAAGAYATREEQ